MMRIIERTEDMAGKWRVMVEKDNGDLLMLKYEDLPDDETVLTEAAAVIALQESIEREREDATTEQI